MSEDPIAGESQSQRHYEELSAKVARNRADIDALLAGAERATGRADASDERAVAHCTRMDTLETRVDLDRQLIAELQADELISAEHVVHLQVALSTSRTIATAMGIVMAHCHVKDTEAFAILSKWSQDSNRKLVVVATEIVDKGDASWLLPASR